MRGSLRNAAPFFLRALLFSAVQLQTLGMPPAGVRACECGCMFLAISVCVCTHVPPTTTPTSRVRHNAWGGTEGGSVKWKLKLKPEYWHVCDVYMHTRTHTHTPCGASLAKNLEAQWGFFIFK